ncbi:MAG TPA: hypothetical protein ENJ82_15415 [Bacteroidetes bacterium]|nr:hypothetical protein [Bacteroidota bacterium]
MKKNFHLVIGLLGAGLVIYSLFAAWNGYTPSSGSFPPKINMGLGFWQGIVAAVAAGLGLVLLVMKSKLAVVTGLIAVGMALFVYFSPEKEMYEPMIGLWLAIGGGALVAIAGLLTPSKK